MSEGAGLVSCHGRLLKDNTPMRIECAPNQQPQQGKFTDAALRRTAPSMFGYMAWLAWLRTAETGPWQELSRLAEDRVLRVALLLSLNKCGPVSEHSHDSLPCGPGPLHVDEELPTALPAALLEALRGLSAESPEAVSALRELSFKDFIARFANEVLVRSVNRTVAAAAAANRSRSGNGTEELNAGLDHAVGFVSLLADPRFGNYKKLLPLGYRVPNFIGQLSRRLASTNGAGDQLTKATSDLFIDLRHAQDALVISERKLVDLAPNKMRDLKRFSALLESVARWGRLVGAGPELDYLAAQAPIPGHEHEDKLAVDRLMGWWCVGVDQPERQRTLNRLQSLVNWPLSWDAAALARLRVLKKTWRALDTDFGHKVRPDLQTAAAQAAGELSRIRCATSVLPQSEPKRKLLLKQCETLGVLLRELKSWVDKNPTLPEDGKFPLHRSLCEALDPMGRDRPDIVVQAASQSPAFDRLHGALLAYQRVVMQAERLRQDVLPDDAEWNKGSVLKTWLRLEALRMLLREIVDPQITELIGTGGTGGTGKGGKGDEGDEGDEGGKGGNNGDPTYTTDVTDGVEEGDETDSPFDVMLEPSADDATPQGAGSASVPDPIVAVLLEIEPPLWRAAILDRLRQRSDDAFGAKVEENFKAVMLSCGIGRLQSQGEDAGPRWAVWVPAASGAEDKTLVPLTPAHLSELLGYEDEDDFNDELDARWSAFTEAAARVLLDPA